MCVSPLTEAGKLDVELLNNRLKDQSSVKNYTYNTPLVSKKRQEGVTHQLICHKVLWYFQKSIVIVIIIIIILLLLTVLSHFIIIIIFYFIFFSPSVV